MSVIGLPGVPPVLHSVCNTTAGLIWEKYRVNHMPSWVCIKPTVWAGMYRLPADQLILPAEVDGRNWLDNTDVLVPLWARLAVR